MTPDMVPSLTDPTQRPDEPLTSGLASGPGPGPSSLGLPTPTVQTWQTGRDVVTQLAANPNASPALQWLASRLGSTF